VARFTNLADGSAETFSLDFSSGRLSTAPTGTITVTASSSAAAPTIRLEQVMTARMIRKGKPVGKPVFSGVVLDYSTAMNPSTAGLAGDYQLDQTVIKRVHKKTISVLESVKFTAAYNPSSHSVTLTVKGKPKFTRGGQIKVITAPPDGVSSEAGVPLETSDTVFALLAKGRGIAPD
jgi:hypothetical protein